MFSSLYPRLFVAAALVSPAAAIADSVTLVEPSQAAVDASSSLDSYMTLGEVDGQPVFVINFGDEKPYPHLGFRPESGEAWDLDAFEQVEVDVINLSTEALKIGIRVDNPGAGGGKNATGGSATVEPGMTGTIVVEFNRRTNMDLRAELLHMQHTPWGKRMPMTATIDPADVVKIQVFLQKPPREYQVAVTEVRAVGSYDPASAIAADPFFPFVDEFGQYIHGDWDGKVDSVEDLFADKAAEDEQLSEGYQLPGRDQYGGWLDGPKLEATGHFRTEKIDGVWHLVTPDGHLFWSLGVCVVKTGGMTPITEDRIGWFRNPPWESDPNMEQFLGTGQVKRGDYESGEVPCFAFYSANLYRKYGDNWRDEWLERTPKRLVTWGFNTIANWSDDELHEEKTIPYTDWVFINSAKLPWQPGTRNRVSDPWNPMLRRELDRRIGGMLAESKDDPWCIGVFVDNELSWGDTSYLATGVVEKGKPNEYAKQAMRDWVKERYDSVEALNEAWGSSYASFADFLKPTPAPTTEAGIADLVAFNEVIVRKYYQTVHDALENAAPNKLYFGDRLLAYANPQVVRVAAEFCDVVSTNLYRDSIGAWRPAADIDKPVIVGEFHFGTREQGVFGRGLVQASSAQDRADKFKAYVESAAQNPQIVGVHWFQAVDQPTSGRSLDAENHGIGFVSVTDKPHPEMLEASQAVSAELYKLRSQAE
ncbi:MAG: beta-galactosidase [Planctomycetota bacterium]